VKSLRAIGPLVLAVTALLVVFRLWVPGFLAPNNLVDLVQQISINAILAFGMTLVILIGGIDLSVGAVVALVGTTAIWLMTQQVPMPLAVLAALAVAGAFGVLHGTLATTTPMPPFIITLATMLVARGLALRFNEGRPMPISSSQEVFLALGNGRLFGDWVPVPVLVMLGVFAVMAVLLHRTRFGQHLYAIGGNREAARYTGIRIGLHEVLAYAICSLCAGLAGLIHCSELYSAEPGSGQGFELNAIAAVVVGGTSFTGGRGSMAGTLLGAVIIGILDKGLNQAGVHFSTQSVAKGLVILAAVYLDVRRRAPAGQ
jgi:ribose transport system permease protein